LNCCDVFRVLTTLNLSSNNLGGWNGKFGILGEADSSGIEDFAEAVKVGGRNIIPPFSLAVVSLQANSTLTDLNISNNELEEAGGKAILDALAVTLVCADGQEFARTGTGWRLNPLHEHHPDAEFKYEHEDSDCECTADVEDDIEAGRVVAGPLTDTCRRCSLHLDVHRKVQTCRALSKLDVSDNDISSKTTDKIKLICNSRSVECLA
jgi:Leucine-rich repeat (LRR) protein